MKKLLRIFGGVLLILVFVVAALGAYLTFDEYNPPDEVELEVTGSAEHTASLDKEYSLMIWNIGYGALGDNADFFMDGGKSVYTADKKRVQENLSSISAKIDEVNPDILFMQEVDRSSSRSYFIDNVEALNSEGNSVMDGEWAFTPNLKVAYIPVPIPPIGKVNSGLYSAFRLRTTSSKRIKLPCPFKWPLRMINLKRCLLVTRAPIEGSDKELVFVNLHLEAYDNGEGKAAQTKVLMGFLQEEVRKGNYVIAGGDFNQTFSDLDNEMYPQIGADWMPAVLEVDEYLDEFRFLTDDSVPTCRSLDRALDQAKEKDPQHFQYYVLDGFIVSSNVNVSSVSTLDMGFKSADHNPLVMKFSLQ